MVSEKLLEWCFALMCQGHTILGLGHGWLLGLPRSSCPKLSQPLIKRELADLSTLANVQKAAQPLDSIS